MIARLNLTGDYGLARLGVVFDPLSLTAVTVGSLAATAAGGAISAAGTLAGGSYARTAGQLQKANAGFEAQQLEQNAGQAVAAGQRRMFDTQEKTRLAIASNTARAGAAGVDAGVGSPAENAGAIAKRGSYHAAMDLFNGLSAATGLENKAKGARYSGEIAEYEGEAKQDASYLAAAGTLASTAGSMFSTYGRFNFPTSRGNFGA